MGETVPYPSRTPVRALGHAAQAKDAAHCAPTSVRRKSAIYGRTCAMYSRKSAIYMATKIAISFLHTSWRTRTDEWSSESVSECLEWLSGLLIRFSEAPVGYVCPTVGAQGAAPASSDFRDLGPDLSRDLKISPHFLTGTWKNAGDPATRRKQSKSREEELRRETCCIILGPARCSRTYLSSGGSGAAEREMG